MYQLKASTQKLSTQQVESAGGHYGRLIMYELSKFLVSLINFSQQCHNNILYLFYPKTFHKSYITVLQTLMYLYVQ